jgi:hypothetical protein
MGLEGGPSSLVRTIVELFGIKNSDSGIENPSCLPRDTLYPQKLALTSPTNSCRLVGIVGLRTLATEFVFFLFVGIRDTRYLG